MKHIGVNIKKQIAKLPLPFWLSFYIFLILLVVPTLAYLGSFGKAAPGTLTTTINQKSGTNDPNPSYTSVFTVQFNEAIDENTFTDSDITLGGTAPGQVVQSITEAGTFNKTTYEVRIQATGAGTITPTIAQELITAQNGASGTNQASTSTDNSVTYSGDWVPGEYIIHVKTNAPGATNTNEFATSSVSGSVFNYSVDCNNDGTPEFTNVTVGSSTCTYGTPGEYDISYSGTIPAMSYVDGKKVKGVKQWGTNTWENAWYMFFNTSGLVISATDAPNFSSGATTTGMFNFASGFNSNINHWDTSNISGMAAMFKESYDFNQPLNNWNVSSVTNMNRMFRSAYAFNQPLNNWDVSSVTNTGGMFYDTYVFNQPLNNWNVSNVTNMWSMFYASRDFNQPLNNWNVSNVTNMGDMFGSGLSGLSTPNYDATLIAWSTQNLESGVTFDAGTSKYCNSEDQRQSIITNFNWNIIDAGKDCPAPEVFTDDVINITQDSATITGSTSTRGVTSRGFQFGLDTSYGSTVVDNTQATRQYIRQWQLNINGMYRELKLDSQDNVYIDTGFGIQKYDLQGNLLATLNLEGDFLGIDRNDNIYTQSGVSTDEGYQLFIIKHSPSGEELLTFGSMYDFSDPTGPGFLTILDVAFDSQNNIYITDYDDNRIIKYDTNNGDFIKAWVAEKSYTIAIDNNDQIYIAGMIPGVQKIIIYNTDGVEIDRWGTVGGGEGQISLGQSSKLAFNRDSTKLAVSTAQSAGRVSIFTPDGTFIERMAPNGPGDDMISGRLGGITFDNNDTLYITDEETSPAFSQFKTFQYKIENNLSGLNCNTTYHFRSFSTNNYGTSYGEDKTFNTEACDSSIGSPQNLTGTPLTTSIELDWDDVTGADHYVIEYKQTSNSTWTEYDDNIVTGSYLEVPGLTPETSYDFRVKAVDSSNNESAWSNTLTISTLAQQTYHITNCQQLQAIFINPVTFEMGDLSGYYILDNDIDCSETYGWIWDDLMFYLMNNDPLGFINIGSSLGGLWFTGTLDGQGYTINNLYQDTTYFSSEGIFGGTDHATITNINFSNYKRHIGAYEMWATDKPSGGLVGESHFTNIENVKFLNADVSGFSNKSFGGIVGMSYDNTIVDRSSFQGEVKLSRFDDFGKYSSVGGVALDSNANAYVISNSTYKIIKYNSNNEPVLEWGSEGTNPGQFLDPQDIVVDHNGFVYVGDNTRNIVQKFDENGTYIAEFDGANSIGGAFNDLGALAVDSNDNIYVQDADRVTKLSNSGSYISEFYVPLISGSSGDSSSFAVDSLGNIFILINSNTRIIKLDQSGNQLLEFGNLGAGSGDGQFGFDYISGIAIDSSSNIILGDPLNNRIQKFNNNGIFISVVAQDVIGTENHGTSNSDIVMSISADGSLVVSMKNKLPAVVKISSSGILTGTIGEVGPAESEVDERTTIFAGLIAVLYDTSISKSFSDLGTNIEVTSDGNYGTMVGGVVGYAPVGGSLNDVYSRGAYTLNGPNTQFGGLVANIFDVTILNAYSAIDVALINNAPIPGNSPDIVINGGAIGSTYSTSDISNIFSVGRINSNTTSAGLIGTIVYGDVLPPLPSANSNISNLYYDQTGSEQESCIGAYYDVDSQSTQSIPPNICHPINPTGTDPNYFKNNTTNPPLDQWDFASLWKTTCEYPIFVWQTDNCVTAPTTPLSPSITDITTSSMKFNWQPPADDGGSAITSYQVQYKASSSSTWINAPAQGPSPTSHVFTNLNPSTSYDFKVSAINAIGSSPYTSPVSATTLTPATPPTNPTNPTTPPTNPTVPTPPTTPTTPTPPVDPTTPTTNTETNTPEPGTPIYNSPANNRSPATPQPQTPAKTNLPILGAVIGPLVNLAENLPKPIARALPYTLLALLLALSALYGYSSYMENQRRKAMQALIDRFKTLLASRATYLRITSHYISTPITKMQGTIELLASGITSTSSSTSTGSTKANPTTNINSSSTTTNPKAGETISPSSNSNTANPTPTNSTNSSSTNLPPPVALATTTTTLTIPENAIVVANNGLKNLANHASELLTEGQSLTGQQQANIHNLEKKKGLSFLTHPAFWLPVVVISTIVILLNIIFIQASRYAPTAITIFSQLMLGFVGALALGVSYYFYQQRKEQTKLTKQQQDIETEFNLRQANFIAEASNKLNDDILVLEGVKKDIAKYPKVSGFTDGLKDLKAIANQLEKLASLSKNVPGLTWNTNLNQTIATATQNIQPLADKQNVTITSNNLKSTTQVAVEEQALTHLITAPIKNAIQASQPGNQIKLTQTTNPKDKQFKSTGK